MRLRGGSCERMRGSMGGHARSHARSCKIICEVMQGKVTYAESCEVVVRPEVGTGTEAVWGTPALDLTLP